MKIKCPACQAVLSIPAAAAGKVVKCPCGKQLRAPAGDASKGNSGSAVAPASAAPKAAAAQPTGVVDPGLFDELTEGDLQPIGQPGKPKSAAAPRGNTASLLKQHAATAGGGSGSSFRVGPLASPWIRLGAAMIDSFVINLFVLPVMLLGLLVIGGMVFDFDSMRASMEAAETEEDKAYFAGQVFGSFVLVYIATTVIAVIPPIILYAVMVAKSGQTPGKKLCKIRILREDTKELPGFVYGMLLRGWLPQLVYCIPFVGGIVLLVDWFMVFGQKRQCLHDVIAGTIVVES